MKYEIVELGNLSGSQTTVYAIKIENHEETLFEEFIRQFDFSHPSETEEILKTIKIMGATTGARDHYFKMHEGKPGDGVCALFDRTRRNLRLFCIRYGSVVIIIGGGALKGKLVKAWQEDKVLTYHAELMMKISNDLLQKQNRKKLIGRRMAGISKEN